VDFYPTEWPKSNCSTIKPNTNLSQRNEFSGRLYKGLHYSSLAQLSFQHFTFRGPPLREIIEKGDFPVEFFLFLRAQALLYYGCRGLFKRAGHATLFERYESDAAPNCEKKGKVPRESHSNHRPQMFCERIEKRGKVICASRAIEHQETEDGLEEIMKHCVAAIFRSSGRVLEQKIAFLVTQPILIVDSVSASPICRRPFERPLSSSTQQQHTFASLLFLLLTRIFFLLVLEIASACCRSFPRFFSFFSQNICVGDLMSFARDFTFSSSPHRIQ